MKIENTNVARSVSNLFRIMYAFEIDRFQIFKVSEQNIKAKIGWPDFGAPAYDESEETQCINWEIQNFDNMDDVLYLIEFLVTNSLLDNDKIIISEEKLFTMFNNWTEKRFKSAINSLLSIKIDMIDDGKKSDFFFFHF